MIVIGIIENLIMRKVLDNSNRNESSENASYKYLQNRYLVRIPALETTGSNNHYVIDCGVCATPGFSGQYNKGDKVYVTFMNDSLKYPIIIGSVYTGDVNDINKSSESILNKLEVVSRAILPENTIIKGTNGSYDVKLNTIIDNVKRADNVIISPEAGVFNKFTGKSYKAKKNYKDKVLIDHIAISQYQLDHKDGIDQPCLIVYFAGTLANLVNYDSSKLHVYMLPYNFNISNKYDNIHNIRRQRTIEYLYLEGFKSISYEKLLPKLIKNIDINNTQSYEIISDEAAIKNEVVKIGDPNVISPKFKNLPQITRKFNKSGKHEVHSHTYLVLKIKAKQNESGEIEPLKFLNNRISKKDRSKIMGYIKASANPSGYSKLKLISNKSTKHRKSAIRLYRRFKFKLYAEYDGLYTGVPSFETVNIDTNSFYDIDNNKYVIFMDL